MKGESTESLIPHPLPVKVFLLFRALLKGHDLMECLCLSPHTLRRQRTQHLLSPSTPATRGRTRHTHSRPVD